MPEQRRIADILDRADGVRRKRKEAIALTEELLRSAFLEMFGDPVTNPKGWPVRRFVDVLTMPLRNGLSPSTAGNHAAKVLTLSAITRGAWDAAAVKDGAFAVEPWTDVRLDSRDLLICRGNGNAALVGTAAFPSRSDPTVVFPDTMIAARVDPALLNNDFLTHLWRTPLVRRQIEASARTTNGTFKVNQTAVENVAVVVPPMAKQQAFGAFAAKVQRLRERFGDPAHDALFDALVQSAFRGELSSRREPGATRASGARRATSETPPPSP
jgi:type I restriction enzyme S subunit